MAEFQMVEPVWPTAKCREYSSEWMLIKVLMNRMIMSKDKIAIRPFGIQLRVSDICRSAKWFSAKWPSPFLFPKKKSSNCYFMYILPLSENPRMTEAFHHNPVSLVVAVTQLGRDDGSLI